MNIILPVLSWEDADIHAGTKGTADRAQIASSFASLKNRAHLNETGSIEAVIETPFFVNYGFPKALSESLS